MPAKRVLTGKGDAFLYMPDKVAKNQQAVEKIRVVIACSTGALSGVVGLTGLNGFLAFFLANLLGSLYLKYVILGGSTEKYFVPDYALLSIGSLFSGLITYVVLWTIAFDAVHVF
ncbi:Rab5-interacting family protein [Diplonema papillatum]|nr:Rab5-interacting family protein [Diplonema papillatum]|eukprot:gene5721-8738_t